MLHLVKRSFSVATDSLVDLATSRTGSELHRTFYIEQNHAASRYINSYTLALLKGLAS